MAILQIKNGMTLPRASTLVIGAAIGYDLNAVRPFISSLRKSGYRGDIALIVDHLLFDSTDPLLADVTRIPASSWGFGYGARLRKSTLWRQLILAPWQLCCWLLFRVLRMLPGPARFKSELMHGFARWFYHPQLSRFLHYHSFLRRHPYDRVLLADVRDVLFQADPFSELPVQGLAVSIEAAHSTLASQPWNALWLRTAYGAAVLEKIGKCPVSCSGVTYGDRAAIARYLDLMVREFFSLGWVATFQAGDQGMHNYLLWTGNLGAFQQLHSLRSPIATLHDTDATHLQFDSRGRLLNGDGSAVSVIHQYDRIPGLTERLHQFLFDVHQQALPAQRNAAKQGVK